MQSSKSMVKNPKNSGIAKIFDKFVKIQNDTILKDYNNIRYDQFQTDILKFSEIQNFDGCDRRNVRLA